MGDLNARSYSWEHFHTSETLEIDRENFTSFENGVKLEEAAISLDLTILNTGAPTRQRKGVYSAPDITVVHGKIPNKITWLSHSNHLTSLLSDHFPIICQFEPLTKPKPRSAWNLSEADWHTWSETLSSLIDKWISEFPPHLTHPDVLAQQYSKIIMDAAEKVIPKKVICTHSRPYFTPDLKAALANMRSANRAFSRRRDPNKFQLLQIAIQKFRQELETAKDTWWNSLCTSLNNIKADKWKIINKILKGSTMAPVQPLLNQDGTYEFNDAEISNRMTGMHVTRTLRPFSSNSFDDVWFESVNSTVALQIAEGLTSLNDQTEACWGDDMVYNRKFNAHEFGAAINMTRKDAAPGPDTILPAMIINAKVSNTKGLHHIAESCWHHGAFPAPWKLDNRIYPGKPSKESYHVPTAYRPVALTSCPGKIMERVLTRRLVPALRRAGLFNQPQFAYIKGLDTTQAILALTLHIQHAFKEGKHTACAFLDLEGAFDAVWRNGVLYKLLQLGIKGRLWLIIANYFDNRKSRNLVNTHVSEWIITEVGVPQGSILAVILFLVFFGDLQLNPGTHVKYADDLEVFSSHNSPDTACTQLNKDLQTVGQWCHQWRQTCSASKSEVMLFSSRGHHSITAILLNTQLKQVTSKRTLGIVLDENLRYILHIKETQSRAMSALRKISVFSRDIGGVNQKVFLMLYKACVRAHLELSYAVWSSAANIKPLEHVQYLALIKATLAMNNSSAASLEVLTSTPPLQLRLQESIILTFCQIFAQPDNSPLRSLVLKLLHDPTHLNHRIITPIHMFQMAKRQLIPHLDLNSVEKIYHESIEDVLNPPIQLSAFPQCSINLGNSGNRTQHQIEAAREHALKYLSSVKNDTVIFTDGSALGNPGPCGAAAIFFYKGITADHTFLEEPISSQSTSFHGEVVAIDTAITEIAINLHQCSRNIHILSDCTSAISIVTSPMTTDMHADIQCHTKALNKQIQQKGHNMDIFWVGGHVDIEGNNLADLHAKQAAEHAKQKAVTLTKARVKSAIRSAIVICWQRMWNLHSESQTHTLLPKVSLTNKFADISVKAQKIRNRLILNHSLLKDRMHRILPKAHISSTCECGKAPETVSHVMMHCAKYNALREELITEIDRAYNSCDTPFHKRDINLKVLLCPDISSDINLKIQNLTAKFLTAANPKV
jgi:ribonuclease HI